MAGEGPLRLAGIIRYSRTAAMDYRLTITVDQSMVQDDKLLRINAMHGLNVYVMIKEAEIKPSEVNQLDNAGYIPEGKSCSQRLRAVLFRLWEQQAKDSGVDKDRFYEQKMETIIQHFKDKLQ